MITVGRESRVCPEELSDYLEVVGGTNRYGNPHFRLVWGQSRTEIAGGLWEYPDGTKIAEMREILKYGDATWYLERWCAPETYGDAEYWYSKNEDPVTKLPLLGPYPADGEYEACYPLRGEPSRRFIDVFVPLIKKANTYTDGQRKAARNKIEDEKQHAEEGAFNDAYDNQLPAFGGNSSSFAGQANRTAPIDRVKVLKTAEELGLGTGFKQL